MACNMRRYVARSFQSPGDLSMELDCIIVGGGPAGLTAATYLRRLHRHVVVFDDGRSRARWIPESHNCPGFPRGVSGTELLRRLRDQASTYGTTIHHMRVDLLERIGTGWRVEAGGQEWHAPVVLLATGVVDHLPPLASGDPEAALRNGLLRSCALCDGYEATDQRIAVVGPLDRAASNAHYLSTFSADVTVVPSEGGDPEASRQIDTNGVHVLPPLQTLTCTEGGWDVTDLTGRTHRFDLVYAAMGAPARGDLARGAGAKIGAQGTVMTDERMETSIVGLYAIGDVVSDLNQIAVAFGHAAIAASAIHQALPSKPRKPARG
ncbi:NAD(P)/FAD-dependent oxidoreductase [Pseudoxanthomonas sp. LARHCG66]